MQTIPKGTFRYSGGSQRDFFPEPLSTQLTPKKERYECTSHKGDGPKLQSTNIVSQIYLLLLLVVVAKGEGRER